MESNRALATTAVELPAGAEPPREIELIPAGEVRTRPHDRRPSWHNPDPAPVVAATAEMGLDLPVDYEHQGEHAVKNGKPAPAAGWIERTFARDGAVWGEVAWTRRASKMIREREYRFISPVFAYHPVTRVIRAVCGAGLTNDPALYMRAIATAQTETGADMDLEKLRKALGLPADAGEDKILAAATAAAAAVTALGTVATTLGLETGAGHDAVQAAAKAAVDGHKAVARAAGLEETAKPGEVETAVKEAKASATASGTPDPSKFVPRAEFDRVSERLKAVEDSGAEEKATAAVDAAVKAGKIAPAQRDWALDYAKSSPDGFKAYVDAAPAIVDPGSRSTPGPGTPDPNAELTADEIAHCRAMRITPEKFKESRKRLHGGEGAS